MLESDPADTVKLLAARSQDYSSLRQAYIPGGGAVRHIPAVDHLLGRPTSPTLPVAFAHERTAAALGSEPRLLIVEIDPYGFVPTPGLRMRVLRMGTLFRLPRDVSPGTSASLGLHFENQPDPKLRVYAGQADPADASHFTIDYEQWGQRDTFDCWLQPDDTVKIKPRKRPVPPPTITPR